MIAGFFNQTLPSSVGGDAIRIWLLAKQPTGARPPIRCCSTASSASSRWPVLVVVCLPWTLALISNPVGRGALLLIGFGAIAARTGFHRLGVGALAHPATLVADASPGGRGQGRHHDPAHAARVRADLRALHHDPPADGAGGLVRGPLGRHQPVAALLAVPGAAGRAGHRRSDFDRRLGRARKRDDRGVRLCRSGAERRLDRVVAVRRRLSGARHRRRPGLDHHRRAERAPVKGDDRRDTIRRSGRRRPRSALTAGARCSGNIFEIPCIGFAQTFFEADARTPPHRMQQA